MLSLLTTQTRFLRPGHLCSLCRLLSSSSRPSLTDKKHISSTEDKYNYNTDISFDDIPDSEHVSYPLVTANDLEKCDRQPTRVKMLIRDFIEDSLYNPNYGYFPQHATIVTAPEESFDFNKLQDSTEFQEELSKRYGRYKHDQKDGPGRQLWHTPVELFKPWYGQAIAQCLVSEYLLKYFPYDDFLIYEIGAGNGTLALNILNFLRDKYPDVYDRTKYTIIEISEQMVKAQEKVKATHSCVRLVHKSIFHWTTEEPAPCFFVALEVVDNFAHDVIRYNLRTLEPYQGYVAIDEHHDFHPLFTKVTDPLISSYMELRRHIAHPVPIARLLRSSSILRNLYIALPFAPNLSKPEYIPTRMISLLRGLRTHFPRHRLLLSDFSSLPDSIPGVNAPVVQTRYRGTTVPCNTLFVSQGWFDIFFPTNFEHLRDMYEQIIGERQNLGAINTVDSSFPSRTSPMSMTATSLTLGENFFSSYRPNNRRTPLDGIASASGLPVGERKSNVFTHAEFLETYADLSKTRLRNGENPMLGFYKNVKFLF